MTIKSQQNNPLGDFDVDGYPFVQSYNVEKQKSVHIQEKHPNHCPNTVQVITVLSFQKVKNL